MYCFCFIRSFFTYNLFIFWSLILLHSVLCGCSFSFWYCCVSECSFSTQATIWWQCVHIIETFFNPFTLHHCNLLLESCVCVCVSDEFDFSDKWVGFLLYKYKYIMYMYTLNIHTKIQTKSLSHTLFCAFRLEIWVCLWHRCALSGTLLLNDDDVIVDMCSYAYALSASRSIKHTDR